MAALLLQLVSWCMLVAGPSLAAPYYGTKIGNFKTYHHDVVGEVYAVDDKTLFVKGLTYDGAGPDAFFWAGNTTKPDGTGTIIPDEKGQSNPLRAYRNENIHLRLPQGMTLRNIRWLAIWCRKFSANFGDLTIPRNLQIPQSTEVGKLPTLEHGVSSGPVTVVDSQTFLIPGFTYDGQGPAAYWWVSRGPRQSGTGIPLADENGNYAPLRRYTGKTVVITLPDDKTIYDFDWLGVWCEEAAVDFGSVRIPQSIRVPPSPRTLGIKSENKLNCEILYDDLGFEVRWIMQGEDIIMQLVGKIENNEYMSFGWSKDDQNTRMINADAVVAWVDRNGRGHVEDYFLSSKEQCVGSKGSCPDVKHTGAENNINLLNAATVNGYTTVTFKRPQLGVDEEFDMHVYSDGPQAIVWAIGPLNNRNEVSYHNLRTTGDVLIDFARPPVWNCPQPSEPSTSASSKTKTTSATPAATTARRSSSSPPVSVPPAGKRSGSSAATQPRSSLIVQASTNKQAWDIPEIVCPADRTFRAQIGPAGGKRGYQAITGHVGWGIAWYINGQLIPEITVQRGKTYTFLVEGGNDPENTARNHPLYITNDPEGGYESKTPGERKKVQVYAGIRRTRRGAIQPTANGRLCEWQIPRTLTESPDDFDTFEEFQENLELKCGVGKAATLRWQPDHTTPDLVYYQCYTHRLLGWKIHVVDSCEETNLHAEESFYQAANVSFNSVSGHPKIDIRKPDTADDRGDTWRPVDPKHLPVVSRIPTVVTTTQISDDELGGGIEEEEEYENQDDKHYWDIPASWHQYEKLYTQLLRQELSRQAESLKTTTTTTTKQPSTSRSSNKIRIITYQPPTTRKKQIRPPLSESGVWTRPVQAVRVVKTGPKKVKVQQVSVRKPFQLNQDRGFIPVIIKVNSSFDQFINSGRHRLASSGRPSGVRGVVVYGGKGTAVPGSLPILVPLGGQGASSRLQPLRRTARPVVIKSHVGTILPHTFLRNMLAKSPSGSSDAYVPLLVPSSKLHNNSQFGDRVSSASVNRPSLVPLVVPENKAESVYVLRHVVSVDTDGDGARTLQRFRSRVVRSPRGGTEEGVKDGKEDAHDHHHHDSSHDDDHREKNTAGRIWSSSAVHVLSGTAALIAAILMT